MPDMNDGVLARSVHFTRQHTTVFEGAPIVSGSAAVLLGNVTNNAESEIELAIGGVDGTLAVFKATHPMPGPIFEASGLGTLSALGLGKLFLGYGDDQQLIACTEEGVCHIFNVRPSDVKWDQESYTRRVAPVWSVTCPKNVTSCCIADIDGDKMQEVVVGTREGGVHVLKMNFDGEQEDTDDNAYSPSSAARSRLSTPAFGDYGLERSGLLAQDENGSDARPRSAREPSNYSSEPSESHYQENQQSMTGPDKANNQGQGPPDIEPVPLSPNLKSLLELKAQDGVTSLSIVYVPETCADPAPLLAAAEAPDADERQEVSPGAREGRPGSKPEAAEQAEAESGAGVYVAVGLEDGAVEVMRLSTRRTGTRVFDLVKASERSNRLSPPPPRDTSPDSRPVSDDPLATGTAAASAAFAASAGAPPSQRGRGDHGPNDHMGGESFASVAGRDFISHTSSDIGDGGLPRVGLGRGEPGLPAEEDVSSGEIAAGGLMTPVFGGGWHVPADCQNVDSLTGRGLVVGLADTGAGAAIFAATPRTPLDRAFGMPARWDGGTASKSAGERSVGVPGGGDKHQVFAVCTLDGCVRCCRVVLTAEGQPKWKELWTRQTKEALHSFQRLDVPATPDNHGNAGDGRESTFVVCSWSGNTLVFDLEGTPCTGFDAEPHLGSPLSAFVAGDFTSPSGSTGPAFVYLGTGGKVVAYHGLLEQTHCVASGRQFISSLRENGSIDTLKELLTGLANRLQWRSNQADPLFPPPVKLREANTGSHSESDDDPSEADSDASSVAALAAAAGRMPSDDEQGTVLSLPDTILARAALSPAGVVVALTKTARRDDRRKSTENGGGGGGGFDYDRWRREVRALSAGHGGTVTVSEGASAVDRLLREIKAWEARGREPTLKNFPCLRGTLEALTSWGSGPRRDCLRRALKVSEAQAETCASPG